MSARRPLYSEPSYYAMMFDERGDDVAYYGDLTRDATRVLEIGIGAGRVAIPLARQGRQVTGVEPSSAMLDALASRLANEPDDVRARVRAIRGDARTLALEERFDWVICPFNGLAEFATADALADVLARVREHLAPAGRFAFDVWLPNPTLLAGASTQSPWFDDPRRAERVRCLESFSYDAVTQVLTATLTIMPRTGLDPPEVLTTELRQFFPEETRLLLEHHGFAIEWRTSRFGRPCAGAWDGVAGEGDDERGEMLAYVCRPV